MPVVLIRTLTTTAIIEVLGENKNLSIVLSETI
jgi:hypothetical protein